MRDFFKNPMAVMLILLMGYFALTDGIFDNPRVWLMGTLLRLPGIVIGLAFHEFAHAKVACLCGDDTPRLQGRVTLNPLAHFDPVGLIALVFIGFGWGKPVQINPYRFKHRRRDEILVSLAGVAMNLLLAVVFVAVTKIITIISPFYFYTRMGSIIKIILNYIVQINLVLMVFNLLPVPPLDGFNFIANVFGFRDKEIYYRIYQGGVVILLALIAFNVTSYILGPAVIYIHNFLKVLFFL